MASKVKVAVLGVGSLGQHHARLYAELAAAGAVEFTGIYDAHVATAQKIAAKHGLKVFPSIAEAAVVSDALNIVTPTVTHYEIAKQLLAQGKHVLVEKIGYSSYLKEQIRAELKTNGDPHTQGTVLQGAIRNL